MPQFITLPNFDIQFNIAYKTKKTEGFLSYMYNPIQNLRLSENRYKKEESTGIFLDFTGEKIQVNGEYVTKLNLGRLYNSLIAPVDPGTPNIPGKLVIEYYANELVDFRTDNLNLDINHPVDIEVQSSYDGSVNLILNDDLNTPKLINTRFTPTEEGQYKIVDRVGNNDTNIYDESNLIGETNLYKSIDKIPIITFNGVKSGGQLKVGNYVFYFKYVDSDGNETDFVGETGIVSIFKGSSPHGTKGYLSDTLSNKLVKFTLSNVDNSYDSVNVYYTKSTGSYNKSELTSAHRIATKYIIKNGISQILITGLETVYDISLDEINISYNVISKAKSQAQAQSRLFLGNVDKTTIPYNELSDLSLRICPKVHISTKTTDTIGYLDYEYNDKSNSVNKNEYYNPDNIYYRLGYWEDIYRLGIVYLMNDFTLSPVFNIRGADLSDITLYKDFEVFTITKDGEKSRNYIEIDSEGFIEKGNKKLENSKGVIRISIPKDINILNSEGISPIGIKLEFNDGDNLLSELKKYTKGFFIVRQKRIPTIYCQGITIGLDYNSHLPVIPNDITDNTLSYLTESFIDSERSLNHDFEARMLTSNKSGINAALIPEAELNSEFYSQLFTASEFYIKSASFRPTSKAFAQSSNPRHYYIDGYERNTSDISKGGVVLTYVNDSVQLISSGDMEFSSKAGTAEEAFRYSQFENEDNTAKAVNLIRGAWGPYVGIEGYNFPTSIFNVMLSGYNENYIKEYFKSRINSDEPYFPICDRMSYDSLFIMQGTNPTLDRELVCYRGDCFIGNFTHRMCRNFQDPEAPTNDKIIDSDTWKEHYKGYANGALDLEEAAKINRGDVNAVKIGHWATFKCMTNINFAARVEDESNASEIALIGHPRTFVPAYWFQADGEYKVPDSTVINVGYNSTTSDKYNFIVPDVPYIKNEYSNRIMYSDIHITDAFKNAFRSFQINNYQDYSKEYGAIIEILEWYGNILIVFEHGVGMLPINERVQTGSGEGGEVYLNSNKVLPEKPFMLSKTFGSQWKDSIVKSERFVYGIDTVGKKIWRTNGQTFEIISDFKIQSYLNDNIKLTEREITPLLGIRNVKSHYNGFKYDIMFTFYNDIKSKDNLGNDITSIEWNICYNEKLNLWTTRYSWIPLISENINNIYFTYDKNSAKNISSVSSCWGKSYTSRGIILDNCYTVNNDSSPFSTKYLKEVLYPGVEFPILTNITKNIAIGKLGLKLGNIDKDSIKSLDFTFENREDLKNDNSDFYIDSNNNLIFKLTPETYIKYIINLQYYAKIDIQVRINRKGVDDEEVLGQLFKDTLTIRLSYFNNISKVSDENTYFWKHGAAGIIDNQLEIKNLNWYDKTHPFEFEFIVNNEGARHKIFDNLQILSNNVSPNKIYFEIVGDSYWFNKFKEISYKYQAKDLDITSLGRQVDEDGEFIQDYIITFDKKLQYNSKRQLQEDINGDPLYSNEYNAEYYKDRKLNQYMMRKNMDVRDIKLWGHIRGNSVYKEDLFYLEIDPIRCHKLTIEDGADITPDNLPFEELRLKDKYIRIKFKYDNNGEEIDKPIVTAIQTIYTLSYN